MAWWVWIVSGFVLGALELMLPGYIFLGFAAGAASVGVILWTGVLALSLPAQLAVFALISLAAWAGLRAAFPMQRGSVKRFTHDIND